MYSGEERRKVRNYCDGHQELRDTMIRIEERLISVDKRINGTIDAVEKHIENSRPRNIAITGVALTIFIWLFNIAYDLGANKRQIDVNTKRWERYIEKNDMPQM